MSLTPGTKLGPYEILAPLGAGGMGEVYRARDTKLGREVAIKVLPEAFAQNEERLARFEREARLLASLNHSNIAQIHGLEESAGIRALVLELVEGPTLADRIAEGPIPLDEALPVARQIAEALEAAHEAGVIHRDLKPANVKVREDGAVKVLDFGLAKVLQHEPEGDPSESPTLTGAATKMGMIMGTAAYMSPEQAKGKLVDRRADIWAFAVVLYEMLTGMRLFAGDGVSDTLALVLTKEVDWTALPKNTPASLRHLLRRCLERDPKQRLRDIGEARIGIDLILGSPAGEPALETSIPTQRATWRRAVAMAGALGLVAGLALAGIVFWGRSSSVPSAALISRFSIALPLEATNTTIFNTHPNSLLTISPDGSHVVLVGGPSESLYSRALDDLELRRIPGTEGARNPFFSPDGESVAFFTWTGELKTVSIEADSQPQTLLRGISMGAWAFGSWGDNDRIVFSTSGSGLLIVSAGNSSVQTLTAPTDEAHNTPQQLPGSEAVLFYAQRAETTTIKVLGLDESESMPTTLLEDASHPRYLASGHLLFVRDGRLLAVAFDPVGLEIIGSPVSIPIAVTFDAVRANDPVPQLAVSRNGTLVYALAKGKRSQESELVWVDRNGNIEVIGQVPLGPPFLQLSSDNTRLALESRVGPEVHISIYDMARGVIDTLVTRKKERYVGMPVWLPPDDNDVIFSQPGIVDGVMVSKGVDGNASEVKLFDATGGWLYPFSFSNDGKLLAYNLFRSETSGDIEVFELGENQGEGRVRSFLATPADENSPAFSPDGHWIAYVSNVDGTFQVYVSRYPSGENTRRISRTGENIRGPLWSRDGKEVFYQTEQGRKLWVVPVVTEPELAIGDAQMLFEGSFLGSGDSGHSYDVSRDGQRFLMVRVDEQDRRVSELVVVQNWFEELKQRVPVN